MAFLLELKTLNPVKDLRSTSGSKLFENRIPDYDDSVVADIRAEGRDSLL
jgi:Asp-tRNA(Asn)/Glu-tRNA(Gln) amidotransferase A subunit family amidase